MSHLRRGIFTGALFLVLAFPISTSPLRAQIPGIPSPSAPATGTAARKSSGSAEKPKAVTATSEGPITVHQQVPDATLQRFLSKFLPKYPGVRDITVAVDGGVVTLTGQVDDDDSLDEITDVVRRVEGVRVVMNQMQTDDELMTSWRLAGNDLRNIGEYLRRMWLLIVIAVMIVVASVVLAKTFASKAETILAPVLKNVLLRSVAGSVISAFLMLGGLLLALGTLRLTHVVLSIVGVASIVGLAVGFAFRDITENFIASVLLGVRRPFQIGDFITVAGQTGVVKSLNTRATVLVTLEGNHVRIPNATVFKEIMVNSTASPNFRNSFDVKIPIEASTADAINAVSAALKGMNGILDDPPPRALIDALEPDGVRIRVYFWAPTHDTDWGLLLSEAKLKTKVALQKIGAIGGAATSGPPRNDQHGNGDRSARVPSPGPAEKPTVHPGRDAKAAASATPGAGANGKETPVARALEEPETRVSEEGINLLQGSRVE